MVGRKLPEARTTRAQRAAEHMGVAAVVLGTSHREAITETIELFGIDGKDHKTVLEQHLRHRAARQLARHADLPRYAPGLLQQPVTQLCQPGSAMGELALPHTS